MARTDPGGATLRFEENPTVSELDADQAVLTVISWAKRQRQTAVQFVEAIDALGLEEALDRRVTEDQAVAAKRAWDAYHDRP